MAEKANETKELLNQLEKTQSELFAKEDELNKSTANLQQKERILTELHARVEEHVLNWRLLSYFMKHPGG